MTACAKSLAEPEDEILDLDSLAEATDEAEKSKTVNSDVRVETLRGHLLEAVKAITDTYRRDAEVAQSLADFLKACTSTNIATPLSLDPLALSDILSHLIMMDPEATWLSISSLLLFRLRKNTLPAGGQAILQVAIGRILERGLLSLSDLRSESCSSFISCTLTELLYACSHGVSPGPGSELHGLGTVCLDIVLCCARNATSAIGRSRYRFDSCT